MTREAVSQLRAMVAHARAKSPFYAQLLGTRIDPLPDDVSEFLRRVPPLERSDLGRDPERFVARDADVSRCRRVRTSGTTGRPVEVVLDASAERAEEETLARHLDRSLEHGAWRERPLVHLALHATATSRSLISPYDKKTYVSKWNLLRAWERSDSGLAQSLTALDGAVVTTLPSILRLICARTERQRTPRPTAVVVSGEQVDGVAVHAERVLGCPVVSLYTLAEAGIAGVSCPFGGYHAGDSVHVELEDGHVLVTPLRNFAMPLLRYRTGERGRWIGAPCACELGPRFEIEGGRRPRWLRTSGATESVISLAKVLGELEIDAFDICQDGNEEVVVHYVAPAPISTAVGGAVASVVKRALGPEATVRLVRAAALEPAGESEPEATDLPEGPTAPDLASLAVWLKRRLTTLGGVPVALVTGSALDPEALTRFSDIDLVFFHEQPFSAGIAEACRALRRDFPKLSTHPETVAGLPRRAPLLTCRLRNEQLLIIGSCDESFLPWPRGEDLRTEARYWAQSTRALLWLRLTAPEPAAPSPLREAWFAGKIGLNALRYGLLLRGFTATAAGACLEASKSDPSLRHDVERLSRVLEVAREHRPPPVAHPVFAEETLRVSFDLVNALLAMVGD